jgi:predicted nucleotidyltransferase component of viral defense system
VKEEALALARGTVDETQRRNVLREYVQALILRSLHESEAFLSLSCVGGTALRFLFGLPRFSEDLDFSVENRECYEPARWIDKVNRDMSLAGFDIDTQLKARKTVNVAWVRLAGILKEAGLSGIAEHKLSIKLEMDTCPPAGAVLEKKPVTRHVGFSLRYHDLPSLMAGKVHALVTRRYPKGRDWFDLLWYRAMVPPVSPNMTLLQNALDQTEGVGAISALSWEEHVRARLESLSEGDLQQDAAQFLERRKDADMLTIENIRLVF